MKRTRVSTAAAVFAAAWMVAGTGSVFAQSSGESKTIYPDASGPKGGSRSERTGESDVPLPKGSPQSGTVEKGQSSGSSSTTPGKARSEAIHPDASGPKGGSKSERTGESDVPLPKDSPYSGTVEKGQSGSPATPAR